VNEVKLADIGLLFSLLSGCLCVSVSCALSPIGSLWNWNGRKNVLFAEKCIRLVHEKLGIFLYRQYRRKRGFIGRPYCRSSLWLVHCDVCLSVVVCDVLYCGETVRPSKKVSEAVNRKPGSKSSFFGSPPYFYFRFRRYGHGDGRFALFLPIQPSNRY